MFQGDAAARKKKTDEPTPDVPQEEDGEKEEDKNKEESEDKEEQEEDKEKKDELENKDENEEGNAKQASALNNHYSVGSP